MLFYPTFKLSNCSYLKSLLANQKIAAVKNNEQRKALFQGSQLISISYNA